MELISLIKAYGLNSLGINKILKESDPKRKQKNLLIGMSFVLVAIVAIVYSAGYSFLMYSTLSDKSLLIGIMALVASIIIVLTVMYLVKGVVVGFPDYEMQMSLPIDNKIIIISRIFILYLYSLVITTFIFVPGVVVYGLNTNATILYYLLSFTILFFIPMIPMIIGIIIGLLIQIPLAKVKNGNMIAVVINFICVISIVMIIISSKNFSLEMLKSLEVLVIKIFNVYPVMYLMINASCKYNILSLIIFITISIAIIALFTYILSKSFKSLNTFLLTSKSNGSYKIGELESSSVFVTLFKKELKKYFSSTLYVFNTSFGVIAMLVMGIATIVMGEEKIINLIGSSSMLDMIKGGAPFILPAFVVLTAISCSAISMEGKNFWISRTIPIEPTTIFNSIIALNLAITAPIAFISSILISIGLKLSLTMSILTIVVALIYCFFTSIFGVVINLKFPNINWKSETEVIKQGMSTLISALGGLLAVAVPGTIVIFNKGINANLLVAIIAVILAIVTMVLYRSLKKSGAKSFYKIS